jgi:hypothetical protein
METEKVDTQFDKLMLKASCIYYIEDEVDVFDPQQLFLLSYFMNGGKGSHQ